MKMLRGFFTLLRVKKSKGCQISMTIVFVYLTILFSLLIFFDAVNKFGKQVTLSYYKSESPRTVQNLTMVPKHNMVNFPSPNHSMKNLQTYPGHNMAHNEVVHLNVSRGSLPLFLSERQHIQKTNPQDSTEHLSLTSVNKIKLKVERAADFEAKKISMMWNHSGFVDDKLHSARISSFFKKRLEDKHKTNFKYLIDVFDKTITRLGAFYFLYGGSLIGSYRHHDMTPWDDDLDVIVPLAYRLPLHSALSNLAPDFVLNKDLVHYWKLYSPDSLPIGNFTWKWPYLDIFFYDENATHIWDISPQFRNTFVYPKSIIFPVKRRPFMGLSLLSPQNPLAVLDQNYHVDVCKTGVWVHRWERIRQEVSIPCSMLHSMHPFVKHTSKNGGCNETLELEGEIMSYFFEDGSPCQTSQKAKNR